MKFMMRSSYILGLLLFMGAIGATQAQENPTQYLSLGAEIQSQNILNSVEVSQSYESLKEGDTLEISFTSKVESVCKSKGCWMKLDLNNDEQVMVRFKDYAFFVPKDIEEKEVIVSGKAFLNEMSVEEQRHYAEDAGATPEEVNAIVTPKKTFSFIAEGVKIKK